MKRIRILLAAFLPLAAAHAQYQIEELAGVSPEGQFTAHNGKIHYWTGSGGYSIYDTASGVTNSIGLPPNGTYSNGYGDAFGVYDSENNLFYAASLYGSSESNIYTYDHNTSSWRTPGQAGVPMINAYGGQVHGGQLYVSGLNEPWDGSYGQDTYISAYDHSATVGGEPPRHDLLIQTSGNSADLAVAPNGDVYYATFSQGEGNQIFRWTADQVSGAFNDLYSDEPDSYLTLADAVNSWAIPGAGNGLAVDAGGNVFFAVNDYSGASDPHTLGWLDTETGIYETIYTSDSFMDWFGSISVDGDFSKGDPLYFSAGGSVLGFSLVPEPSAFTLITALVVFGLAQRRKRS